MKERDIHQKKNNQRDSRGEKVFITHPGHVKQGLPAKPFHRSLVNTSRLPPPLKTHSSDNISPSPSFLYLPIPLQVAVHLAAVWQWRLHSRADVWNGRWKLFPVALFFFFFFFSFVFFFLFLFSLHLLYPLFQARYPSALRQLLGPSYTQKNVFKYSIMLTLGSGGLREGPHRAASLTQVQPTVKIPPSQIPCVAFFFSHFSVHQF